ncbi:membrane integrity-associated transporter subunit PqiC [Candidimonas sp. SYP-B2681]|uniref:PqiC family protein n=1 Tax=Candidimonas sp. SYP-B2681 TaxID=2497686 RepID=UPI000F890356|nr:PqiC family protein [Candidimonas sp. SYP-B2681]RTZ47734.1 membrane integrity-associated transporter subunit PqiC [Candidimonas sp. SYP-B2681]
MQLGRFFCIVTLGGILAACATAPVQYYTLATPSASQPVALHTKAAPQYAISVQPVGLPEQVDRPQIVISDPAAAQVIPLNGSLWASPLSDEIRNALSNELTRSLGVLDIASGSPDTLPVWRVDMQVQRFESLYNQHAVLEATWRLTPVNQANQKTKICRGQTEVAVEPGMSAMVVGHQLALRRLATIIADQLSGRPVTKDVNVEMKGCTF